MWFRLQLDSVYGPDLCALVGKDGKIYWRICDVARLLKKTHPHELASRHVKDKIVRGAHVAIPPLNISNERVLLLATEDVFQMMTKLDPIVANQFSECLRYGTGMYYQPSDKFSNSPLKCPKLVRDDNGSTIIKDWIGEFAKEKLKTLLPNDYANIVKSPDSKVLMVMQMHNKLPDEIWLRNEMNEFILYKRIKL